MKRSILWIFAVIMTLSSLQAAKVEEVKTFSKAMNKEIPAIVITPNSYSSRLSFPVVYLLHGHGGNYTSWAQDDAYIKRFADTYNVILVLPDGGRNSWYMDSPVDASVRYETYICDELIPYIDKNYSTVASREGRGITGLSMGGHGALYLAFRHQDLFGVAGSTSGGVDFRPWPLKWGLPERLGSYATHQDNWEKNTVINMIHLLTPGSLALIVDCGREDFFFEINQKFHQKLLYHNIPHEYHSRPGKHNWAYWKNSIAYQMLFMNNYFRSQNQ